MTSPAVRHFPGSAYASRGPRAQLQVTCSTNSNQGRKLPVDLPGGGGLWLGSSSNNFLYGQSYGFVIKREKVGGEGLVVFRRAPKPVHVQRERRKSPLAPQKIAPSGGLSLVGLDIASCSVIIDTDFEVLNPSAEIKPNTSCTGLVLVTTGEESEESETEASKHPRRTRKVGIFNKPARILQECSQLASSQNAQDVAT